MNDGCQRCQEQLLDHLYGEIEDTLREGLEAHLAGCERCQEEASRLGATRSLMEQLPLAEPTRGIEAILQGARRELRLKASRSSGWFSALGAWLRIHPFGMTVALAATVTLLVVSIDLEEEQARLARPRAEPLDQALVAAPPPELAVAREEVPGELGPAKAAPLPRLDAGRRREEAPRRGHEGRAARARIQKTGADSPRPLLAKDRKAFAPPSVGAMGLRPGESSPKNEASAIASARKHDAPSSGLSGPSGGIEARQKQARASSAAPAPPPVSAPAAPPAIGRSTASVPSRAPAPKKKTRERSDDTQARVSAAEAAPEMEDHVRDPEAMFGTGGAARDSDESDTNDLVEVAGRRSPMARRKAQKADLLRAQLDQAGKLLRAEHCQDALPILDAILREGDSPWRAEAYLYRGKCRSMLGNEADARSDFALAATLDAGRWSRKARRALRRMAPAETQRGGVDEAVEAASPAEVMPVSR